jgi:hypothetical protein
MIGKIGHQSGRSPSQRSATVMAAVVRVVIIACSFDGVVDASSLAPGGTSHIGAEAAVGVRVSAYAGPREAQGRVRGME